MKKDFPLFVWHKRAGKMLSSKVLQAQQSPRGDEKTTERLTGTPAEQFLRKLRNQVRKGILHSFCFLFIAFCLMLTPGCTPQEQKISRSPLGKWKREATYLNGKFNHERPGTLILTKTSFKLNESNCEMNGAVSYQAHAMIFSVTQNDCQGVSVNEKLYYGYEVDRADGSLRIFHNNHYNDTIRDVYRKIE